MIASDMMVRTSMKMLYELLCSGAAWAEPLMDVLLRMKRVADRWVVSTL